MRVQSEQLSIYVEYGPSSEQTKLIFEPLYIRVDHLC